MTSSLHLCTSHTFLLTKQNKIQSFDEQSTTPHQTPETLILLWKRSSATNQWSVSNVKDTLATKPLPFPPLIHNPWVALLGLNGVPAVNMGWPLPSALCRKEPRALGRFSRVLEWDGQQHGGGQWVICGGVGYISLSYFSSKPTFSSPGVNPFHKMLLLCLILKEDSCSTKGMCVLALHRSPPSRVFTFHEKHWKHLYNVRGNFVKPKEITESCLGFSLHYGMYDLLLVSRLHGSAILNHWNRKKRWNYKWSKKHQHDDYRFLTARKEPSCSLCFHFQGGISLFVHVFFFL